VLLDWRLGLSYLLRKPALGLILRFCGLCRCKAITLGLPRGFDRWKICKSQRRTLSMFLLKSYQVEYRTENTGRAKAKQVRNPISVCRRRKAHFGTSRYSIISCRGCILLTVVKPGSKVAVEMSIRCKSFSTANEPGGLKYFTTKEDTDFNELAFTIGDGQFLPGLEEGMMGMHKNGLRRIEVPATMVFAANRVDQLPLPTTKDGKRRFENLFKTDATLLFEVLVTRVK
jgi:hypothetical protein